MNEEETEQVDWTILIDLAEQLVELSTTLKEEQDVRANVSAG
jgi:hypothetical protein